MGIKRQISEVDGIQDPKVERLLREMKSIIEDSTGRLPNKKPIVKLGPTATLPGVINKINEIIGRLQEE